MRASRRVPREVRESSVVLLPCVPASVAAARHRITADLLAAGIFEAAIGDAALVLSELLSNAILHARPLPDRWLQVAWELGAGSVEIAVSDGGSPTLPRAAHPPLSALGGRGLEITGGSARTARELRSGRFSRHPACSRRIRPDFGSYRLCEPMTSRYA